MRRKVVLASKNQDKVREMQQLFSGLDYEVLSSADFPGLPDVIEDGTTIVGNARRKAILTAAYTGEISVADDTSLEVRELNGFPDIFAARFSGAGATYSSNVELMLELMADVPEGFRQARFSTACVWVDPRPRQSEYKVARPAVGRWLRNPWTRSIGVKMAAEEWDFWNSLVDRRRVWDQYRRGMELDISSWGHDSARLVGIADGLFRGCADALRPGEELDPTLAEEGVRLPDTQIWAVTGPETTVDPLTVVAPSGLPAEAPGRAQNGPFWFEISAVGRVVGDITTQPLGSGGFGYDPVFRPEDETRTLAEMPADQKNAISHRGRAMRRLIEGVGGILPSQGIPLRK
jgi:non-canonical purine NTP pyrophosphatase (RdgB/HAM1 family)